MATDNLEAKCPDYSINQHLKDGYVTVIVKIPGMKVTTFSKKLDKNTCTLQINFAYDRLDVDAELHKGTMSGTKYHLTLEKDELEVSSVKPEPDSKYKVEENVVRIFVKK